MAENSDGSTIKEEPSAGSMMQERLWRACHACDGQAVMELLDQGVDAKFKDETGITPLMTGMHSGLGEAALRRLAAASDLSALDHMGESALHAACSRSHPMALEWVRADPALGRVLDKLGRPAAAIAARFRWGAGMMELLGCAQGAQQRRRWAMECLDALLGGGLAEEFEPAWRSMSQTIQDAGAQGGNALARVVAATWGGSGGRERFLSINIQRRASSMEAMEMLWAEMTRDDWLARCSAQPRQASGERAKAWALEYAARQEAGQIALSLPSQGCAPEERRL